MAIDRTTKWRCQWQGSNGWANMLEIIPAGDWIAAADLSVTTFSRSAFEMDFAEYGFEDLPIGMMKAPAASFSFIWANLPSGLKELLKTPRYTPTGYDYETTTLFYYWNDEGTSTLQLQYVGAQANTLGNKFTYKNSSVYSCQIETFDLMKTIMDNQKSTSLFKVNDSGNVLFPNQATGITTLKIERFLETSFGTYGKYDLPPSDKYRYLFYSIAAIRNYFGAFLDAHLIYWTRITGVGLAAVEQTGYPDVSLTFYVPANNTDYDKSTALDETNTLVLGHVCEYDGSNYTSLAGFFSNDKEGVAEFDSMSTFIAALCENFVCKFIYKPIVQVVGAESFYTYELFWLRPFDSVTTPVTLTPKITADSYDITTAEKVFLIAESEIKNMSGDNINMARVSTTVSDKNDTWSAPMLLHNLPTLAKNTAVEINSPALDNNTDVGESKTYLRKLYYLNGIYYQKIHTSVTINDGVNTYALDTPIAKPGSWSIAAMQGWALEMQQTQGLPQAVAAYITTHWADPNQALRDFPCEMVTAEIMPHQVGDIFTLPTITDIGVGASSPLLSVKPDWDKGILDCKFLSLP